MAVGNGTQKPIIGAKQGDYRYPTLSCICLFLTSSYLVLYKIRSRILFESATIPNLLYLQVTNVQEEPTALKVAPLPFCADRGTISIAPSITKPQTVVFVPLGGTVQGMVMRCPLLSARRDTTVLEGNKRLHLQNTTVH